MPSFAPPAQAGALGANVDTRALLDFRAQVAFLKPSPSQHRSAM
jgi:hypothetical protein